MLRLLPQRVPCTPRTLSHHTSWRCYSVHVSPEVAEAIASNTPVVSLESTIITHGLPFPQNIEMAQRVELIVRENGAIPATCAFINGKPRVGLSSDDLHLLGEKAKSGLVTKVSRRDIGPVMASKTFGGTTISLTMILSDLAGISVFATGGLGGVHRGAQETFDVSADLTELGKTPVLVVCLGPKLILDISLTMEYLETQGVLVSTFNDDGHQTDVPGFYTRTLGVPSPYLFDSFAEAAAIISNQRQLGLQSGNVFCIPPPKHAALLPLVINSVIDHANKLAMENGISGKKLTPFLLGEIAKATQGKLVVCNVEFVYNNARAATEIAKALVGNSIDNATSLTYSPLSIAIPYSCPVPEDTPPTSTQVLVVGSLALDTIATMPSARLGDSNPGKVSTLVGGVGHNIAVNSAYGLELPFVRGTGVAERAGLVSIVGDDVSGKKLVESVAEGPVDVSGVLISSEVATSQYVAHHDGSGELVVACADMSAIESDFTQHIGMAVERANPKVVVVDCNLSPESLAKVIPQFGDRTTIIDPTSYAKAARVASINTGVFPRHQVDLITPTIAELDTIHTHFDRDGKFDDLDHWFPVLDQLGANQTFRDRLQRSHPIFTKLLDTGVLQQLFHLLPYLPYQIIKLGGDGVVAVHISTGVQDYRSIPTSSPYCPQALVTSTDGGAGIVVKYWKVPTETTNIEINNVTGAGDAFIGFILATLTAKNWLTLNIPLVELEWYGWECIYKAQIASGLTLQSELSTTNNVASIA